VIERASRGSAGGRGAVRDHFLKVLEDALDLGAVGAVVFDAVDEGRDGDAAGVRGAWGQVFGRAASSIVSTNGQGFDKRFIGHSPSIGFDRRHDVMWCD